MGIQVNEPLMTKTGIEIPSYYMGIGDSVVSIHRMHPGMYTLSASFGVWVSKEAKDAGRRQVSFRNVEVMSETPFTANLYDLLYDEVKKDLDYTDCI